MKTRPFRRGIQHRASCVCGWAGEWGRRDDAARDQELHDAGCTFIDDARECAAASAWIEKGLRGLDL